MKKVCAIILLIGIAGLPLGLAQNFAPPLAQMPDETVLKAIREKFDRLEHNLGVLGKQGVRDVQLVEADIYRKAARMILAHEEFYDKAAGEWTVAALDRGLLRASQLAAGETPWLGITGRSVVRAYRSRVDNSIQPYAVTFPEDYGRDKDKKYRVDVVLHGRDAKLSEVSFLQRHNGDKPAEKKPYVQIDIFGRGNNAYRWAGEADVAEAVDHFIAVENFLGRGTLLDSKRFVLRGFSMGGAGTWHLGLHRPDRWCVLGPGAGFTMTRGYIGSLPDRLPPYVESCLKIYDAVEYAENVFDVPVVAYSGENDKQKQAADNIEKRLGQLDLKMTHLVGLGLEHSFPKGEQARAEAEYAEHVKKGRAEYPTQVRFVTYTLKYPSCDWVEILGLDEHYKRARVDATEIKGPEFAFRVQTENVRTLHLALPPGVPQQPIKVAIDKDEFSTRPYLNTGGEVHLYLEKREGHWHAVLPEKLLTSRLRQRQKINGLQGPIDDAFMNGFLCVRGTGKPWNQAIHDHAEGELKRFQAEWSKYFRGELQIKDDIDVKPQDMATQNLILFGDPGSNSLIAQVLDDLPLTWTRDEVALGGAKGPSATHLPVLIYPSPLNGEKYVVLNSGHTFHEADLKGTNALLYPRLGDYALVKLKADEKDSLAVDVVRAGLFDDYWQLKKP
jgi:hypothetical protein